MTNKIPALLKKNISNILIFILSIVVLVLLFKKTSSGYVLSPISLTVEAAPGSEGSIFDKPNKIECAPGPDATADYYTKSLTPGGICGGQDYVNANNDYKITGGIGGSLLDDAVSAGTELIAEF